MSWLIIELFPFQLIGCVIIGYMAWVLATSVTVSKFLDGSLVSNALIAIMQCNVHKVYFVLPSSIFEILVKMVSIIFYVGHYQEQFCVRVSKMEQSRALM